MSDKPERWDDKTQTWVDFPGGQAIFDALNGRLCPATTTLTIVKGERVSNPPTITCEQPLTHEGDHESQGVRWSQRPRQTLA